MLFLTFVIRIRGTFVLFRKKTEISYNRLVLKFDTTDFLTVVRDHSVFSSFFSSFLFPRWFLSRSFYPLYLLFRLSSKSLRTRWFKRPKLSKLIRPGIEPMGPWSNSCRSTNYFKVEKKRSIKYTRQTSETLNSLSLSDHLSKV